MYMYMYVPVLQVLRLVQCLPSLPAVPLVPEVPWVPVPPDHQDLLEDQRLQQAPLVPTQ